MMVVMTTSLPAADCRYICYINCRDFAVIFAIFTKVCRIFNHFCRDFLLSLAITTNIPAVRVLSAAESLGLMVRTDAVAALPSITAEVPVLD